jgi:hypothetical protein
VLPLCGCDVFSVVSSSADVALKIKRDLQARVVSHLLCQVPQARFALRLCGALCGAAGSGWTVSYTLHGMEVKVCFGSKTMRNLPFDPSDTVGASSAVLRCLCCFVCVQQMLDGGKTEKKRHLMHEESPPAAGGKSLILLGSFRI